MKNKIVALSLSFVLILSLLTACGKPQPEPDTVEPEIFCEQTLQITFGEAFYYLNGVTAIDDADGDITHKITVVLPEGVTASGGIIYFPEAKTYVIKYKVSDAAGNSAEKSVTVTVNPAEPADTNKPVISGHRNFSVKVDEPFDILDGVTAIDDVDGDVTQSLTLTLPAGGILGDDGTVKFTAEGNYEVKITAKDSAGNEQSVTVYVHVTDVDTAAPVFFGADDVIAGRYSWLNVLDGVTASDNTDGDVTSKIFVNPPEGMRLADNRLFFDKEGKYEITYNVYDNSGNLATIERGVTVNAAPDCEYVTENDDMRIGKYTLYSTGSSGTITRAETSVRADIAYIDVENEIYLERGGVYFRKDLAFNADPGKYYVNSTLSGALASGGVEMAAGYYDGDGKFVEFFRQPYVSGQMPAFTPGQTTTDGAFRFYFTKTGAFTLTGLYTETSTTNLYGTRDSGGGRNFALPMHWVLDSSPSGYSAIMEDGALKVNVTTASSTVVQYENFALENGGQYAVSFNIKASKAVTKNFEVGSSSTHHVVSNSLSSKHAFSVDIGTDWTACLRTFTASASNDMYKFRIVLSGTTDIVYYITDFIVSEYVPNGADGFIAMVGNIAAPITESSEDAIIEAYAFYDTLSVAEKAQAAAAYATLNRYRMQLYGVKHVSFKTSVFARNEEIDLTDLTTKLDYDEIRHTLSSGTANAGKVSYPSDCYVTAVYELLKGGEVIAERSREISVVSQKVKDGIVNFGEFNKYKYELETEKIGAASVKRTPNDVTVNVADDSGYVYLERLGLNFRPFTSLTALTLTYTASGITPDDISVVFGYYGANGAWNELKRKDGVASGAAFSASDVPSYATADGVMRIEIKKAGSLKLTAFVLTIDGNYVSRDGANSPMDAPAHMNLIAVTRTGLSYGISYNTFNYVYGSAGSTSDATHICFEDITMQLNTAYTVSFAVKGAAAYTLKDSLVISNYNRVSTSNSYAVGTAQNIAAYTVDVTTEFTRVEFTYTTDSTGAGRENFFKIMLRMTAHASIFIKDVSVYPAA